SAALREAVETWLNLLYPFTPHLAEELWSKLGNKNLLVNHPWPVSVEADEKPMLIEKYLEQLVEDTYQILKAVKKTSLTRMRLITAAQWKNNAFREIVETVETNPEKIRGILVRHATGVSKEELGRFMGQVMKNLQTMTEEHRKILKYVLEKGEQNIIKEAQSFFEKEFKCSVETFSEDVAPMEEVRIPLSKKPPILPGRPAILLES
ncbi:MAG: class I tRNA ligase family protein, partial [Thermoproteota archaeon]